MADKHTQLFLLLELCKRWNSSGPQAGGEQVCKHNILMERLLWQNGHFISATGPRKEPSEPAAEHLRASELRGQLGNDPGQVCTAALLKINGGNPDRPHTILQRRGGTSRASYASQRRRGVLLKDVMRMKRACQSSAPPNATSTTRRAQRTDGIFLITRINFRLQESRGNMTSSINRTVYELV